MREFKVGEMVTSLDPEFFGSVVLVTDFGDGFFRARHYTGRCFVINEGEIER